MLKTIDSLKKYIAELNRQYQTGIAREHTYRPALQRALTKGLVWKIHNCG
jgi:hypothetical protein